MIDLNVEHLSVWRELRHGSLGTVLWVLRTDRQAAAEFSNALSGLGSSQEFATALELPAKTAANSLGQLALHQLAAEAFVPPHVEPRDGRWSPFRVLPAKALPDICKAIAHHPEFIRQAEVALSMTVEQIKRPLVGRASEGEESPGLAELHRHFLKFLGIAFGQVLLEANKEFFAIIGEVSHLNGTTGAPLYPFSRSTRKGG